MSEAFNIIIQYFNEFSRGVDTYLATQPYDPAVCKDAYIVASGDTVIDGLDVNGGDIIGQKDDFVGVD